MTSVRRGQGTNQEAVRRHNLGTLLRHVHGAGRITRAELTATMGLNRSTIGALVAELEALGVTEQTQPSPARSGAGRPSARVRVTGDGPYVLAVDVGVATASVGRIGLGGRVLQRADTRLGRSIEPWQVGTTIAELVREVVAGASGAPLVGLGIAVPGLVRRTDGLVRLAPNLGWHDVSFGEIVQAALGLDLPIALGNDADLGALAEHNRGAAVGVDDLMYISGNVGVGAGILAGGRRLEGAAGYAGEIGHLNVKPRGRPCHCGSRGCLETEIGGEAIARALGLPAEQVPDLIDVLLTLDGRPESLRVIGHELGQGLADLVNAFNPEMVVLGGYLSSLHALCRDDVEAGLVSRVLPAAYEGLTVVPPGLGRDSILLGAAEMAFEPLFSDPEATLDAALLDVRARLSG
ncbi:ROK family protein [Nocardioides sp. GXQ0305]|uniref:ROK family protein n=1 Tax=Nocardioides sp. GXQ0305 TaxID=3423912 RepID=UPI003D7E3CE1